MLKKAISRGPACCSRLAKPRAFLYALDMKHTECIQVRDAADEILGQAARRIEAGDLVAFPTETVYGIACKASLEAIKLHLMQPPKQRLIFLRSD